jgi:hypothetical protein
MVDVEYRFYLVEGQYVRRDYLYGIRMQGRCTHSLIVGMTMTSNPTTLLTYQTRERVIVQQHGVIGVIYSIKPKAKIVVPYQATPSAAIDSDTTPKAPYPIGI